MTLALKILAILAIVYILTIVVFYFFQHYFFFRPEILPQQFKYSYPFEFEENNFDMEDGGSVNSILFKVPNSRGVIYYFKGNSRSIKGWGKFAVDFVRNGYDFFIMDYRGFGKSKGKRSEQKLYNDSQQVYKWLTGKYSEDQIVIYGRSLGSGIAARIASWNRPAMLILDSPYFSFYHNIKRWGFWMPLRWLLRYPIRTDQFIGQVKCPVYILHGTNDQLIPFWHSEKLKEASPDNIVLVPIDDGRHNNLPNFPDYHKHLYDLLNQAVPLP